jgi:hypothetical protein
MSFFLLAAAAAAPTFQACPAESEVRRFLAIEAGNDFAPVGAETIFRCDGATATISVTTADGESVTRVLRLDGVRTSARPRVLALACVELWRAMREAEAEHATPVAEPTSEPSAVETPPFTAGSAPLPATRRLFHLSLTLGHDASNIYASELTGINLAYYGVIAEGAELISATHVSPLLSTFTPIDVGGRYRANLSERVALLVEIMASATLHTQLAEARASFWTANGQTTFTASYHIAPGWVLSGAVSGAGRYLPFLTTQYGKIFRVVFVPGVRLSASYFWSRYAGIYADGGLEAYLFYFQPQRDPTGELQVANAKIPRFSVSAGPQWRW